MKDIKDYLHLYLGCPFIVRGGPKIWDGWRGFKESTAWYYNDEEKKHIIFGGHTVMVKDIQLVLRPLSDMSNVEAHTLYNKYFGRDFAEDWSGDTGSAYFNPKKIRVVAEHGLRIINGEDYETGDFMKVVELVPYLLSKHFDLFGLIEAGLAIDKTKLQQP